MWNDRHPSVAHFNALFDYSHLPEDLTEIAEQVTFLADTMVEKLPDGPELAAGLRKLLEAKDCFVRARVLARG